MLVQNYPNRKKEFSEFKEKFECGNVRIASDASIYQQVICLIYGPNYPSNIIDQDEVQKLIDNMTEECIKSELEKELTKLMEFQKTMKEYQDSTRENCERNRDNANALFQQNINSININNHNYDTQNPSFGGNDASHS